MVVPSLEFQNTCSQLLPRVIVLDLNTALEREIFMFRSCRKRFFHSLNSCGVSADEAGHEITTCY